MADDFLTFARSYFHGEELQLARRWQAALAADRLKEQRAEALRFERTLEVQPGREVVILARARKLDGTPYWAGLPLEQLLAIHSWVTGSTGSGKSFLVLASLIQVLRTGRHPVLVLDMKGELSNLLTTIVVPALADTAEGQILLDDLRIIQPFNRRYVPQLRITLPEPGVPREIQAYNIANSIEEALEGDLPPRGNRLFLKLVSFAIERNDPLTVIQEWLERPERFARQARDSADPSIREYANGAFLRENRSSMDALMARMDTFLFLPATRLALSAPRCVSFADCLDSGLTDVDVGNPPAGAERAARFWAGVLVGRLTRSILSRNIHPGTPQTWVLLEEFQEALAGRQIDQFARLLALARFKKVGLCFINQQVAQVDPKLTKLLRTNTGMEAIFRCSMDDAKTLAHALPVASDEPRATAKRQALLQDMTRLPRRTYYAWFKEMAEPFGAQKVRSPRLDLNALRAAAGRIPDEVKTRIEQGTVAMKHEDLEAQLAAARQGKKQQPSEDMGFLDPVDNQDTDSPLPRLG